MATKLKNVSILTAGEAKGHNLLIDETSLQQALAVAQSMGRIKVTNGHGAQQVMDILGYVENFRIEGSRLLGDLTLLNSDKADYVANLAGLMPDQFGLSLTFSGVPEDRALVAGGKFYADLDPNFYFWQSIGSLKRDGIYDSIIRREIEGVSHKDEEIEAKFGVSRDIFNHAEFGKDIAGGFKEDELTRQLVIAGFSGVKYHYHWFLGEAAVINGKSCPKEELLVQAKLINDALQRALPVSRNLFKYIGFVATR